jgi:hypothetical protein
MQHERAIRFALYAILIAVGLFFIVREPVTFTPDSHEYRAGAESILREGRYLDTRGEPQQVWAPATSLLYAGLARMTGLPVAALVKPVNAGMYVVLAVACVAIAQLAELRTPLGAAMLAAIACNGVIVSLHDKMLSEAPTFATLALLLLTLTLAQKRPQHATAFLAASIVLASLAILFRYAMLPVIPLVMIVAILQRRWIVALAAPLAVGPLFLTLAALGASRGERTTTLIAPPWRANYEGVLRLADQVFPAGIGGAFAVIAFVAICLLLPPLLDRRGLTLPPALWALGYGAFLPIAQVTAVPSFPFDVRILMPVYIGGIIGTATACETLLRRHSRWAIPLALALGCAALRGLRFTLTQALH